MQQLSGQDATFIYIEEPAALMHVAALYIYDQSTAPKGKVRFKEILKFVGQRLHTSRVFRQKLVEVPFNLDHPYWIEDADFDLEFHVRHIALPKPGDWRQFCIQIARLHSRALDMSRPLWEMYVIEGLDNIPWLPKGSFAIMTKIHHAAVDGATGAEITATLHDTTIKPRRVKPKPWAGEQPPGLVNLLARAAINNTTNTIKTGADLISSGPDLARQLVGLAGGGDQSSRAPFTRFNHSVTPHRVFEGRVFELDEIRALREPVEGATVNDVVLTMCSGALRKYLEARGELPNPSLVAMAPVNTRRPEEKGAAGNQVALMGVQLFSDIADPVERLTAVRAETASKKEFRQGIGARQMTNFNKHVPAATLALVGRMIAARWGVGRRMKQAANCVITNVPGPQQPLYMNGAKLVCFSGLGPIAHGLGLIFIVTSYNGQLVVSFTSDRSMVHDPEELANCLQDSFEEMKAAILG